MNKPTKSSQARHDRLVKIMDAYHNGSDEERKQAKADFLHECEGFIGQMINKNFSSYKKDHYYELYNSCVVVALEKMGDYDPDKSRLTTFLTPHFLGAISQCITDITGHTSYVGLKQKKVKSAMQAFQKQGIDPSPSDVAIKTGLSVADVELTMASITAGDLCYFETTEEMETAISDFGQNPEDAYIDKDLSDTLYNAIAQLPDPERTVIAMEVGLEDDTSLSSAQVAKELNTYPDKIRNYMVNARYMLRQILNGTPSEEYHEVVAKQEEPDDDSCTLAGIAIASHSKKKKENSDQPYILECD